MISIEIYIMSMNKHCLAWINLKSKVREQSKVKFKKLKIKSE
jgi:hypothetical protein